MDILPSKVREYFVSIKLLFVHQVYGDKGIHKDFYKVEEAFCKV